MKHNINKKSFNISLDVLIVQGDPYLALTIYHIVAIHYLHQNVHWRVLPTEKHSVKLYLLCKRK